MDYTTLRYTGTEIEHDPCYQTPEGIFLWSGSHSYAEIVNAMKKYKKRIVENDIHDYYEYLTFRSTTPIEGWGTIFLSYDFSNCHAKDHVLTERMHYETVQWKALEKF